MTLFEWSYLLYLPQNYTTVTILNRVLWITVLGVLVFSY